MLNRILIDPQAFAMQEQVLADKVCLKDLDERTWLADIADTSVEIHYTISGGTDTWQRPFLDLAVSGSLLLNCQRCMQPTEFVLDEQVRIVLFHYESDLDEAMIANDELEGMVLENELDILTLVEDQILMALPISPKHKQCHNIDLDTVDQDKPNPFAVLAGLKKG